LRLKVKRLQAALQELTRKIGKKRDMGTQDRDDVSAAEILQFRLDGH
jgi:hypothetical protein